MDIQKWDYEKHQYKPYEIKENWNVKIFTGEMNEKINCANCGKKLKAGDSHASYEIQNVYGLGYMICEKCFELELLRKRYWRNK